VTITSKRGLVNNQVTLEIPEITRKYVLNRRAERQDETRERIVDAAVALHHTIGPAHTTDVAIAEKAGVTRRTLYRHFPDDLSLFRACTSHSFEKWPPPQPDKWRRVADPQERLRLALGELYAYYRVAGAGLVVIMRDRGLLRAELLALPGRADTLRAMPGVLLEPWKARGRRRQVLAAALVHATAVTTWQSLVMQQHLSSSEAEDLLIALVRGAAQGGRQKAE
jgi:AcrR family transcriptional regulator